MGWGWGLGWGLGLGCGWGGGNSHGKETRMLVISLRVFVSLGGVPGKTPIFSAVKVSFRVEI